MAALPPAGVNLQAQGFSEYIRKLDAIEKKNREVFDTELKGTSKTFAQVTKAARDYERQLKKTAEAEKKAARGAQKLAEAQKTAIAAQRLATIATVKGAAAIAQQVLEIGKAVFELGKLGAQFDAQRKGLDNLAASFGQVGVDLQRSIVKASRGTISDLKALQVANEALLLGVARTPEEFDKFTRAALTLGRTVGISASESISRFTTALGRESLLRLDDFGAKASEVNEEIKRLAQAELGKLPEQLTKAEKSAIFIEAALSITSSSVEKIGEDAANAAESFDRMTTAGENLKTELGLAVVDLNETLGITEGITKRINELTEGIKVLRVGFGGETSLEKQIEAIEIKIRNVTQSIEDTRESLPGFLAGLLVAPQEKVLTDLQMQLEALNFEKAAQDARNFGNAVDDIPPAIEDNTKAIKAYSQAIEQAEQLQLSFARTAEDSALKLLRANEDLAKKQARATEDIARKQAQQVAKLEEQQTKARDKLLKDQQKQLDKFEDNRRKRIAKAEDNVRKERQKAADERKRDEQKLQRELQRARERFNLSRLQSERQFNLSERRLRAEGDILALQELREDFALQQQEEKENFDLSQKETKQGAKEQQREQANDLKERLDELKADLDDRRAELLSSFDEQLKDQQQAQAEAQRQQQIAFQEQAAERAIAEQRAKEDRATTLAREEEDRRISQARQLEDLGISLARQEGITEEGVTAIAGEMEKVFGAEGVADNIITGFTERTESDFSELFKFIKDMFKEPIIPDQPLVLLTGDTGRPLEPVIPPRLGGVSEFQEGGIVPGPIGSSQIVRAHAGETILPTHQNTRRGEFFRNVLQQAERGTFESFRMSAPVIPSQEVSVRMSGGFNVTGDGQANDAILQAAAAEMTENFKIAVRRLRRNN